MEKINLLHLKKAANVGGAEALLTYFGQYLNKDKFNQFVIFGESGPLLDIMKKLGAEVLLLEMLRKTTGILQLPKLVRFIKINKIDLIHAHGARVNFWGAIASFLTGVPIISTEHNIDPWREYNIFFNIIDRFSAAMNTIRVGVSGLVCDMLRRHGVKRVVCIDNGIDAERFNIVIDVAAKKKEFGFLGNEKIIGTVGRLVEQKGHKYFIEAAKKVVEQYPETRFLIIGDGPLREELERQIRRENLYGKVLLAGERSDIPELLAIIDIFVLPSIAEGLPLALLEAMAAGKPIVATRAGGITDVVDDRIDGLLIESKNVTSLASAIVSLMHDEKLARSISLKAREKADTKYGARSMVAKYEKLYLEVLKKNQAAKP